MRAARLSSCIMPDSARPSGMGRLPSKRLSGPGLLLGVGRGRLFGRLFGRGRLSLLRLLSLGFLSRLALGGCGLRLCGGLGGGLGGRRLVASRENGGSDEGGCGGGEKLGVDRHDVVGVRSRARSVLLAHALSYAFVVVRMPAGPSRDPSRIPSSAR